MSCPWTRLMPFTMRMALPVLSRQQHSRLSPPFRIKEFKDGLDHTRHFYASNPGMWVREAAHHLNECLATLESPLDYPSPADIFSARPGSALTKDLKKYLVTLLEECGDAGRQSGYE